MSRFCLDRKVLGTVDHLVVDEGTFSWAAHVPPATWHLDGNSKDTSDWCLDTVLRLGPGVPRLLPPEPFVRQMSGLVPDGLVPWGRTMPARAHLAFVKMLVAAVDVAMATAPLDYYRTVWVSGNGIFRSLQRAAVDRQQWTDLMMSGDGNVTATSSFEPGDDGLAQAVSYDRFRTLTGRLVVSDGPQILTLKKAHRCMLRSIYGSRGAVYALDFAALEARILLYEHGRRCDDVDLYGMIARELGYDRDAVKGAVISKLYGSSRHALGRHLGISGRDLDEFVNKIQVYFDTDELLHRVKTQFIATGKLTDRYGRPVTVDEPLDNIFVAYYGQATGVDITMLGFRQVVDVLAMNVPKARPIFLLHDAIFIDIPCDDVPFLEAITYVKVPGYVQRFPLRLERVSG